MGYIYAMSNKSMPGILKIGMTERSIEERLREANGTFTLTPFIVEMSKYVSNCKEKEKCIHQILQSKWVNPKREFFQITIEEIKPIFDLIDTIDVDYKEKYESIKILYENTNEKNDQLKIKFTNSILNFTFNTHIICAIEDFVDDNFISSIKWLSINEVKDYFKVWFSNLHDIKKEFIKDKVFESSNYYTKYIEYIIETSGDPDLDENSDYYGFNNIEFKYN